MAQKGLDGVLRDHFKIGVQAGIAVVTPGLKVRLAAHRLRMSWCGRRPPACMGG